MGHRNSHCVIRLNNTESPWIVDSLLLIGWIVLQSAFLCASTMGKKSNKPENKHPVADVEENHDINTSEGPSPAHRALPEFLQTLEGVESFMQKLKQKCNLNKKFRYVKFGKVCVENVSVEDIKTGYRKLRTLCFTNLTLKCELDIIEEHYRKFFDTNGKFVDVNDKKSLVNREDLPPPKPLSSYILFCKKMREKTRKKHPELTFKEVSVVIAKKWRELSNEKRKIFDDEATRLKSEYETKLEEYHVKFPPVGKEKKKKERGERKKRPAKPPKSALDLFVLDNKQKYLERGLTHHNQMQEAAFPDFYKLDSKEREAYDIRVKSMYDEYMNYRQEQENRAANGKRSKENNKVKSNDLVESDSSDNSDMQEPPTKKSLIEQPKSENPTASSSSPRKEAVRVEPVGSVQQIFLKSMPKESDSESSSSSSSSSDSEKTAVNATQVGLQNSKMLKFLTTRDSGKSRFDEKPPRRKSTSSSSGSSDNSDSEEKPVKTAPLFPSPKKPVESKTQPIKFEKSSSSSSSSSSDDVRKKVSISKSYTKQTIAPPNFATPDLSNKKKKKL
uniref:HMG box domain-containing protein n=1 Tax=Romanomermis culicivorax TaxID=13658 RepID=A0A915J7D9_ROMCU